MMIISTIKIVRYFKLRSNRKTKTKKGGKKEQC